MDFGSLILKRIEWEHEHGRSARMVKVNPYDHLVMVTHAKAMLESMFGVPAPENWTPKVAGLTVLPDATVERGEVRIS